MNEIITIGLFNTGFLLVLRKWGWLNYYDLHRPKFFPKGDCYLCLSFWMGMAEVLSNNPWNFFVTPISASAITVYLMRNI